jgi:hypothetical protein
VQEESAVGEPDYGNAAGQSAEANGKLERSATHKPEATALRGGRSPFAVAVHRSDLHSTVIYNNPDPMRFLAELMWSCNARARRTVEVGLLGIPSVIAYQCRPLFYAVGSRLMRVKFIGMVNILLDEAVQPEFFQKDVDAIHLADKVWSLLTNGQCRHIQARLAHLPEVLGPTGVMHRVAHEVRELLKHREENNSRQPLLVGSESRSRWGNSELVVELPTAASR